MKLKNNVPSTRRPEQRDRLHHDLATSYDMFFRGVHWARGNEEEDSGTRARCPGYQTD